MIQLCFKLQNMFLQFLLFFLISFSDYKTVGTEQYAQQKYGLVENYFFHSFLFWQFSSSHATIIELLILFEVCVKNGYSYIITFH